MGKDAYYFSHDMNARRDPKILALRKEYGRQGYGDFWMIIEMLAEQEDYQMPHKKWVYHAIAMELPCETNDAENFVKELINDFELLSSDGEHFWSESLKRRMDEREKKRQKRVEAGKKGAQQRWEDSNTKAKPKQSQSNAIAKDGKGKESKGNERKENKDQEIAEKFNVFWNNYPKKEGKKPCEEKFKSIITNKDPKMKATADEIIKGELNYIAYLKRENTERKYIKNPLTFLNQRTFDDYQENEKPQLKAVRSVKDMSLEERIAIGKQKIKELEDQIALSDRGIIPGDDGNAIPLERAEEWLENARERLSSLQEQVRSG